MKFISTSSNGVMMKKFMVTAMFEGKLESWECYGNSVSHVKKYITDHWNEHLIYGAKIIKVEPLEQE